MNILNKIEEDRKNIKIIKKSLCKVCRKIETKIYCSKCKNNICEKCIFNRYNFNKKYNKIYEKLCKKKNEKPYKKCKDCKRNKDYQCYCCNENDCMKCLIKNTNILNIKL